MDFMSLIQHQVEKSRSLIFRKSKIFVIKNSQSMLPLINIYVYLEEAVDIGMQLVFI